MHHDEASSSPSTFGHLQYSNIDKFRVIIQKACAIISYMFSSITPQGSASAIFALQKSLNARVSKGISTARTRIVAFGLSQKSSRA